MKKILALAAVAALTAGVSAFAANPFSDVTPDDWAYQAISDLSDQGVVEGYPDGTFKGERNMTRYELAQIIARLMAREDQLNAEQRATLDKLAGEYSDELANLGVRVGNLEKKVGNISWFGDARMRYQQRYGTNGSKDGRDRWDGRMRINVKGQVNENTYVRGRMTQTMNYKDGSDANTTMDMLYAHHQFTDKVGLNVGRFSVYVGQTALFIDDYMSGLQAFVGDDSLMLEAGYGYFKGMKAGDDLIQSNTAKESWYARVVGNAPRLSYDVEYYDIKGKFLKNMGISKDRQKIWGVGATGHITKDIDLYGDFYQNTAPSGDPHMWLAGLSYGHASYSKPGSWRLSMNYVDAERGASLGTSTFFVDPTSRTGWDDNVTEVKYWMATGDVTLAKNVNLHAEYAFHVDDEGHNNADYDNIASFVINYKF